MDPRDPRHGTEAGHEQHLRDGEDPCDACVQGDRIASRRRGKRKAMGYRYQAPLGDIYWRIQALRKEGATYDDLMEWSGVVESQIWRVLNGSPETLVYARTWHRLNDMQPGRIITPLGVTRRIRALMWLGYSADRIATAAGCHVDTVRDARDNPREFLARKVKVGIADAYDQLSIKFPEGATKQERAGITRSRNYARRRGWLPPLAWDNIDDQNERPSHNVRERNTPASLQQRIDMAVVWRLVDDGVRVRQLTSAEAREAYQILAARGLTGREIERRYGINALRYSKEAA